MSIKITTPDGRTVWDDDLAVALRGALLEEDVPVQAVLDHLYLISQAPSAYGTSTAFAAKHALKLIKSLADAIGEELGIA